MRRCIGAAFAQLEIKTVLRTILASARLSAPDTAPERQLSRHVTLVPGRDALVRMDARVAAADNEKALQLSSRA